MTCARTTSTAGSSCSSTTTSRRPATAASCTTSRTRPARAWATGPEVQLEDNAAAADPVRCGWLYALYQPPIDPETGKTARRHQARRPVESDPRAHQPRKVRARGQRREVLRIRAGQRRFPAARDQEQVRRRCPCSPSRTTGTSPCRATTGRSLSAISRFARSRGVRQRSEPPPRGTGTGPETDGEK